MSDLLAIEALRAGYGEAVVLPKMSLRLPESQVLALLGRNGTGKTTLINSIVGVTRRFGGTIALGGMDLTAMRPDQRARAGIGWVPQERNIFRSLTVEEIREIVDLLLNRVRVQLQAQQMELVVTAEAKDHLIKLGYDMDYGARPLRRVIQNMVEDPLAEKLLLGAFEPGTTIVVDKGEEAGLDIHPLDEKTPVEAR